MNASPLLSTALIGTWELVSRQDRNAAGELRPDPTLGADPLGLLIYDRGGHFAAQFMKRDRTPSSAETMPIVSSANNTRARDGYDAYFGIYSVDDERGTVTQTLQAALSVENVGHVVTREMAAEGDVLTITLNTTSVQGEAVTRTLRWRRVA
jgi:hypothetical protein